MISKEKITINKARCEKCGHSWQAQTDSPKRCPQCKRADWNKASKKQETI